MPSLASAARAHPSLAWGGGASRTPRHAPSAAVAPTLRVGKDKVIFSEADRATHVYRVLSGVVRTSRLLSDGRRQIEAFHFEGEVFGLEVGDEHRSGAEAVQEAVVAVYHRGVFEGASPADAALSGQLVAALGRTLSRAREHMVLLGCKSALERVAAFLIGMSERLGGEVLRLPMTRADIADHLGLTTETVSRSFTLLERAGLIEAGPDRRSIVLRDVEALRRLDA